MKNKILLLACLFMGWTGALRGQSGEKAADARTAPRATVATVDTVYLNATQYALDSLKYAAEYELQTELAKLRNERYKDSVVYARMNSQQLFQIQMSRQSRYWTPPFRHFMESQFPPIIFGFCILFAFGMVLQARDKGKQRAHEQKMAQFEALQKARIVWRERGSQDKTGHDSSASDSERFGQDADLPPDDVPDYAAIFQRTQRQVASYIRSPRRYRKTGVILLILAVGMMVFFGVVASGAAWGLGLIPLFIGFAYLYLDYASQASDRKRRQYEEFKRYQAEKAASAAQGESPAAGKTDFTHENSPEETLH